MLVDHPLKSHVITGMHRLQQQVCNGVFPEPLTLSVREYAQQSMSACDHQLKVALG
jgi:hypothetical protein